MFLLTCGTNQSRQKCRFLLGCFKTEFLQEQIWCVVSFFNQTTIFVLEGVDYPKRRVIFLLDANFLEVSGFYFVNGLGFLLFLQALLRINTVSLLIWRVCLDLLMCFLRLFDLLVFGQYGRSERTVFSMIRLLIRYILSKKLS